MNDKLILRKREEPVAVEAQLSWMILAPDKFNYYISIRHNAQGGLVGLEKILINELHIHDL